MNTQKLNIAGRLAGFFVASRLTVLFFIACALLMVVTNALMPREENPQIDVPGAQIMVQLPGASPQEVEQLVVRPLEGMIKPIAGVDHVFSASLNSVGVLNVQFKVGEDKQKSLVKLYDSVLGQRDALPPDASPPVIRSVDVDDVPIVTVTLASEKYDDYALKRLADHLADGLRSLDNISVAFTKGGRDREVRIALNPARAQAYGMTLDQIRAAFAAGNVSAPLGAAVQQGKIRPVVLDGFITSLTDLEQVLVGLHQGRPIYLGDVASIVDGPAPERERNARFAFGPADARFGQTQEAEVPAVTLAVAKKPGTNSVAVARDVLERIERMKTQFVPAGVELIVTRNDGQKANAATAELFRHIGVSVIAVFLICTVFLGLREASIVVLTVPLILALTLFTGYLFGLTLNRVTLFSIVLSLGLLVDAAIVVIENIHRRYALSATHEPEELRSIAVEATNEIGNPTNLATLAVMLVFGSMLVISGMMGEYFHPTAIVVPVAMALSVCVAYIVVPWAASRWLKPVRHSGTAANGQADRVLLIYRSLVKPFLDHSRNRYWLFAGVTLALALSLLQPSWQFLRPAGPSGATSWLGVEMAMMVKGNKNTFNISIDMPADTLLETTDRLAREIGTLLRQNPDVQNYQSWIGEAGVVDFNGLLRGTSTRKGAHVAEIRVNLVDKELRRKSSIILVRELRPAVQKLAAAYPGSTVQLVEDPPGPGLRATLLAEIYGHDLAQLRDVASKVEAAFHTTYDIAEVINSEAQEVAETRLVVDREKAALSGVSVAETAIALRRLIAGEELGRAHFAGEKNPVPIRLQVPRSEAIDPAQLSSVTMTNRQGQRIALADLVRVETRVLERTIQHKDGERVAYVGGELASMAPFYAVVDLNRRLDGMRVSATQHLDTANLSFQRAAPDTINGMALLWDGEPRLALDVYRDMLIAMALAIVSIFIFLVAYYRAFDLPLVAMAAIPLGLIGVFPGHWLMHAVFTSTSMVGVIALAGIVVRNSLLIIDFTLDFLRQGMAPREAIIEACAVRLRPILLTALAIVLGSAVMLGDPAFGGLAISLIFGTIASTVLSMLVIPAILYLLLRHQARVNVATHAGAASIPV